jgi:hypothetical protein
MRSSDHGTSCIREGGDGGELRLWHIMYQSRRGRWGTPTMALHVSEKEGTMGNSDHGTSCIREGGDDGELRPWHFMYQRRRGRWETPTMALHA